MGDHVAVRTPLAEKQCSLAIVALTAIEQLLRALLHLQARAHHYRKVGLLSLQLAIEAGSTALQLSWVCWTRRRAGVRVRLLRMAPVHHETCYPCDRSRTRQRRGNIAVNRQAHKPAQAPRPRVHRGHHVPAGKEHF
eukprot:jgi/Ulvmu1/7900/UM004_0132.1